MPGDVYEVGDVLILVRQPIAVRVEAGGWSWRREPSRPVRSRRVETPMS